MRMKIFWPLIGSQIDDHRPQVLLVLAAGAVEDALSSSAVDNIDARLPAAAAADEEAGDRDASL